MEGTAAIEPTGHKRTVILASVFGLGLLFGGLRLLPFCIVDAGPFGWKTWTRVYPNLVCSLNLENAGIREEDLNERLDSFTNLRSLNLDGNTLTRVPQSVLLLERLESLSLQNNDITSLPNGLGGGGTLHHLDLSGNNLQTLPDSLGDIGTIDLSGNDDVEIPPDLDDEDTDVGTDESPLPSSSSLASEGFENSSQNSENAGLSSSMNGSEASSGTSSSSGVSSSSSTTSSNESSTSSGNTSSASQSSEESVECNHNFTINGYEACLPSGWTAVSTGPMSSELYDNEGITARVQCPMSQENYPDWEMTTRSRTYVKNGLTQGADLWTGEPFVPSVGPFKIIFMHRNDFASWFGNNYEDIEESCQIRSERPWTHDEEFLLLYLSVQ